MRSQALRHVHRLALSSRRFERQLVARPRHILQGRDVPEAEIRLIETLTPQNAIAFGLAVEAVERTLYEFQDDISLSN